MESSVTALKAALRERLTIIADAESRRHPAQHVARLQAVSAKIEALEAILPENTDPRLRHFLERRSYDKALDWLETAGASGSR